MVPAPVVPEDVVPDVVLEEGVVLPPVVPELVVPEEVVPDSGGIGADVGEGSAGLCVGRGWGLFEAPG